ncbi:hypothetical protein LOTGIDRAFT_172385, partial [Lottia gigantea]
MGGLKRYYKTPGISENKTENLLTKLNSQINHTIQSLQTELCFYIQATEEDNILGTVAEPGLRPRGDLKDEDVKKLSWILSTPFQESNFTSQPQIIVENNHHLAVEIGP